MLLSPGDQPVAVVAARPGAEAMKAADDSSNGLGVVPSSDRARPTTLSMPSQLQLTKRSHTTPQALRNLSRGACYEIASLRGGNVRALQIIDCSRRAKSDAGTESAFDPCNFGDTSRDPLSLSLPVLQFAMKGRLSVSPG